MFGGDVECGGGVGEVWRGLGAGRNRSRSLEAVLSEKLSTEHQITGNPPGIGQGRSEIHQRDVEEHQSTSNIPKFCLCKRDMGSSLLCKRWLSRTETYPKT